MVEKALGSAKTYLNEVKRAPIWPIILGAFLILLGILYNDHGVGIFTLFEKKTVALFISELGFAFVIAFVISVGIEMRSRREHNALVAMQLAAANRNIFEAIYKVRMPPEVFQEIEEKIIKQKFYRKNTHIYYTFSSQDNPIEGHEISKIFKVEVNLSYDVENLSDDDDDFDLRVFIETPLIRELSDRVQLIDLLLDGKSISREELEKARRNWADTENYIRYRYPIPVQGGHSRKVEIIYEMVKLERDNEAWRSFYPCDSLRLTLILPTNLTCSVDAIHPDGITSTKGKAGDQLREFRIDKPLLPAHGVLFWWSC